MTTQYLIYDAETDDERSSITVILGGVPMSMTDESPDFAYVRRLVLDGAGDEELRALFQPVAVVGEKLAGLSERVTTDGRQVYFDGDVLDDGIARHILRVLARSGADNPDAYMPTVRFLEKLATNPSMRSRGTLYQFLRRFDMTITADGDFIGYKGIRSDFRSHAAGPGVVDGVPMEGHLPNHPGSVLSVPRSYVNADPHQGCSHGLHVGTYRFASGYARGDGRMVAVKVNPRDVVCVPQDANFQKVRVCRYTVLTETAFEYESPLLEDQEEREAA